MAKTVKPISRVMPQPLSPALDAALVAVEVAVAAEPVMLLAMAREVEAMAARVADLEALDVEEAALPLSPLLTAVPLRVTSLEPS